LVKKRNVHYRATEGAEKKSGLAAEGRRHPQTRALFGYSKNKINRRKPFEILK
jgi:hypothetical protein